MIEGQLHLSYDRKVSPEAYFQKPYTNGNGHERKGRWVPSVPNSFGLPAGLSCPGITPWCGARCYGMNTERYSPQVRAALAHNYNLLTAPGANMEDLLYDMIARYCAESRHLPNEDRIFRIHWDGDFFSNRYAQAWAQTIRVFLQIKFWTYTRSFTDEVNVLPHLLGYDNLTVYLSIDEHNLEAGKIMLDRYKLHDLRAAFCADGYEKTRELADSSDTKALKCPENSGRMDLVSDDGRGACTDCGWCIKGTKNIMFSAKHREQAFKQSELFIIEGMK